MLEREGYHLGRLRLDGQVLHSKAIDIIKCFALSYSLYLSIFK